MLTYMWTMTDDIQCTDQTVSLILANIGNKQKTGTLLTTNHNVRLSLLHIRPAHVFATYILHKINRLNRQAVVSVGFQYIKQAVRPMMITH